MNGQRDIERVLEHWLLDGSNAMPERLFDAVLDRVERVPQRRLARLNLRWTEMNPRIRLYTLAAAGLAVALVGLYLFNRAPGPNVGATPSPAVTPSPVPVITPFGFGPVQNRLLGRWLSGPRSVDGIDAQAGISVLLTGDAFAISPSNDDGDVRMRSRAWSIDGTQLNLELEADSDGCSARDRAKYFGATSPSGRTLTFERQQEACEARGAALSGTFWKMDCPATDDNCLGPLDAGVYASQFFDPFIGPGETWAARYGALGFTVPEGWVNLQDWPDFYELGPAGADAGTSIFFIRDVVLSTRADLCSDAADPDAGSSPDAIATALRAPGLTTSTAEAVTIGGLAGVRMDVALEASAASCPYSEGRPAQELLTDRDLAAGFSFGVQGEERRRLYLLEVEPDRTSLVVIQAPTQTAFDSLETEATAIVESLAFNP